MAVFTRANKISLIFRLKSCIIIIVYYDRQREVFMYKKTTLKWLKHWDFIVLNLVLMQLAFSVTYILRNGLGNPYDNSLYRQAALVVGLLDLFLGVFLESYSDVLKRGYWIEIKNVVRHVVLVTLGLISYLFLAKEADDYSRMVAIYFPVVATVFIYIGRILLKLYLRNRIVPDLAKRRIMLIGAKENYRKMVDAFMDNQYSQFYVEAVVITDSDEIEDLTYRDVPIVVGKENVIDYLQEHWIDEALFSIPQEIKMPDDLIEKFKIMGITTHLKLARLENERVSQMIDTIEGYTVLSTSVAMASPMQLCAKRLMDIVGGLLGVFFTGILFIFVAPVIFIKSPGPIFFKQIRVGRNGRKFKLYKFRSMYMDAEERKKELMEKNNIKDGRMFKMDNDPRIIKGIGNFIRDYSIDEFPQFWNVLKGDMSLVGTRPPTVDEWEKYELHHRKRLAIKPGITGLWQVSGRSKIVDFEEVVKLDTQYIREWDLGMDIRILLKTVRVVLGKKGAM